MRGTGPQARRTCAACNQRRTVLYQGRRQAHPRQPPRAQPRHPACTDHPDPQPP